MSFKNKSYSLVVNTEEDLISYQSKYVASRLKDLEDIKAACATGDYGKIKDICHRIKGNAKSYGFEGLGEIAKDVESYAVDQNNTDLQDGVFNFEYYLKTIKIQNT